MVEITACDFSPMQRLVAVGLRSGGVRLLDCVTLAAKDVLPYDLKQQTTVEVAAVCCAATGKVVVGYANGVTKEFKLFDPVPTCVYLPPGKVACQASFVETAESGVAVVVGYNEVDGDKRAASLARFRSGKDSAEIVMAHPKSPIVCMRLLEKAKIVAALGKASNELTVFDYNSGDQLISVALSGMAGLTDKFPLVAFCFVPVTKKLRQVYVGDAEVSTLSQSDDSLQGNKGDILALAAENGSVLTALFSLTLTAESKVQCNVLPQNLYRAQTAAGPEVSVAESHRVVTAISVDPVTDRLLIGDREGNIKVLLRTVLRVLNPEKAKNEDAKEKEKSSSWSYRLGLSGWTPLEDMIPTIQVQGEERRGYSHDHGRREGPPIEIEMEDQKRTEEKKGEETKEGATSTMAGLKMGEEISIPKFLREGVNKEEKSGEKQPVAFAKKSDDPTQKDLELKL